MNPKQVDLLILGGGINGAGIAADAASRGLSVLLCDKADFGSATSSASSKLIHGGLRYLEQMAFHFVRDSLKERDRLLNLAPHLVKPLRFIIPHNKQLRKLWMMKLGLFMYDHLGASRLLPRSKSFALVRDSAQNPLCLSYKHAVSYYDASVDDARLVIANLLQAQRHGAELFNRAEVSHFEKVMGGWLATCTPALGQSFQVQAKVCVNATGPWAQTVLEQCFGYKSEYQLRAIKGSHIVVPRLYSHEDAYLLQHFDSRVVFVIPYHRQMTMIGTTDVEYFDDPDRASCSQEETQYLCDIVSKYFHHPIRPDQVLHQWSGVRPLVGPATHNPSTISREHKLELLGDEHPVLNVFGGKLTTYRSLAEHAVDKLEALFPNMKACQTRSAPLPGGDIPKRDVEAFWQSCCETYPFINPGVMRRFVNQYGTQTLNLLGDATSVESLGEYFGHGFYERELLYLCEHEWAQSIDDIIWRRTKLGYFLTTEQKQAVQNALAGLLSTDLPEAKQL